MSIHLPKPGNPVARSLTRRREAAAAARKSAGKYSDWTRVKPRDSEEEAAAHLRRVNELLWAQAHIERALWLETGGVYGDEVATPKRIAARDQLRPRSE